MPPSLKLVLEKRQSASREFCRESGFLYLVGDWQNEAYFSDIRDLLLKDLVPKDPPGVGDRKIMDLIKNSISVSIHMRRGDYVTSRSASSYHGLCSIDYYHKAIAYLAERIFTPTLFVFSDDPEWVKIHLKPSFPTYYVDHNLPEDAVQDLRLMSLCKHHIIANSSFSWWGRGCLFLPRVWLLRPRDGSPWIDRLRA